MKSLPIRIIFTIYILISVFAYSKAIAQIKSTGSDKGLVQLSGIVTSTRIGPIPFATVKIKSSYLGAIAAFDGFYSLVVKERDTVEYSAIGFKKAYFIVPASANDQKYIYSPLLGSDTISFRGPTIGPRTSYDQFRQAFLNLKLADTYADNARRNLDPETLSELYETLAHDGGENQQIAMQQIANAYYYSGYQTNYNMLGNNNTPVPTSLLNPFAWAQFFQAIKDGKYKKKETKKKYDF
jgi:hypothetical protein